MTPLLQPKPHPKQLSPHFFFRCFLGARFCTVEVSQLRWNKIHILAFSGAPQGCKEHIFHGKKHTEFRVQEVEIHTLLIWLNQFSCGIYFLGCEICQTAFRIALFCLNGLFLKHQHATSNPFGNLLPQHHFDEGSFNPINKNSTRGLPRKRIISKKHPETHSPNNVSPTTLDPAAIYTVHLGSPCRMLDP